MSTGIKISSPATYFLSNAFKDVISFALNTPSVSIVFKQTDGRTDEIKLFGMKDYKPNYIQNYLSFLRSLDIFSKTPKVFLEINNKIPFNSGLGSHVACFSALVKGLSILNKLNLTNRELYEIIVLAQNSPIDSLSYSRFLSSLDGGCMLVDNINPILYQRIYMPNALNFILYKTILKTNIPEQIDNYGPESNLKSLELILGLNSTNWKLIKAGLENTLEILKNLNLTDSDAKQIEQNCLGVIFNAILEDYLFLCENTLEAETCLYVLQNLIHHTQKEGPFLFYSQLNNTGSKQF